MERDLDFFNNLETDGQREWGVSLVDKKRGMGQKEDQREREREREREGNKKDKKRVTKRLKREEQKYQGERWGEG